jgi:hypothetical protein
VKPFPNPNNETTYAGFLFKTKLKMCDGANGIWKSDEKEQPSSSPIFVS